MTLGLTLMELEVKEQKHWCVEEKDKSECVWRVMTGFSCQHGSWTK